jgi:outer membrane protein assembly factor BamB
VVILAALAGISTPAPAPAAADWPAWRGPAGTGVAGDDGKVPLEWDEARNVRWRTPLPDRGNSTPAVWGDRAFVTQAIAEEHRRTVMCFGRADGKLRWQAGVTYDAPEPTNGQNPYCAASPVTDGTRVIAYFGSAGLYCYDMDGKELWHADVGRADSWHGSGSSPVIYRNLCVVNAGPGTSAALVALDRRPARKCGRSTRRRSAGSAASADLVASDQRASPPPAGRRRGDKAPGAEPPGDKRPATDRWAEADAPPKAPKSKFDKAGRDVDMSGAGGFTGSWSTPLVVHAGGRDELVVSHASKLAAYDPATGRELWTCDGMTEQVFASPTAGEGLLIAAGKRLSAART